MVKQILQNLPTHYREGVNLNLLVDSIINEFDELNDYIVELKTQLGVNGATGDYLDEIGRIFNLSRIEGETDTLYRIRIKTFWAGFNKYGTQGDLITLLSLLLEVDETNITITDGYKAPVFDVNIGVDDDISVEALNITKDTLNSAKAAGTYVGQINVSSQNGVFLTHVSDINGIDKIL